VVRDSSATGALIELGRAPGALRSDAENLPARFTLFMTMDRVAIDCKLVWRKGSAAGLQYAGPARLLGKQASGRRVPAPPTKSSSLLSRLMKKSAG
jgi:hypothetical protein